MNPWCNAVARNAVVATFVGGGLTSAEAQVRCIVNDLTGTPLNVRSQPNGQIIGSLHNDVQVFISDEVDDSRGRRWARVIPVSEGKKGWVYRTYLTCR